MEHGHHPPVAGISIEGDNVAGQQYIPRAKAMLHRLVQRVKAGHVKTCSDFTRLDDSAYCYAVVSGNIHRAVIVVEASATPEARENAPAVIPTVPDFYSGAITGPLITKPPPDAQGRPVSPYLEKFWPTPDCASLFHIPEAVQRSTKLAVEPGEDIKDGIGPPEDYTGPPYSQYVRLRPTMYSGRMRGVVQLLMGFGKQIGKSIYDRAKPALTSPAQQAKHQRTPTQYEKDVKANGLQIRYDWRWYRTHGIGVGADGALWLVEIGNTRGVVIMPLPFNKVVAENLTEFRAKLEQMDDAAGLYVLDTIGGWPTGESFPGGNLDAWMRAGRVIQLATKEQMDPFYGLNAITSAMGWAFNDRGNECHNIGLDVGQNNYRRATHYGFSFTIGESTVPAPAPNAQKLKLAIGKKSGDDNFAANVWKCDMLTEQQIADLFAFNTTTDSLYAALDAIVVDPIADATGHLWQASQGMLHKTNPVTQFELKYPWPELGFLVSLDLSNEPTPRPVPRSDTDVHVFYIGDQLKVVKFFNDERTANPESFSTDDPDGCDLVGTFTTITKTGPLGIPPMVYSADFDDRAELNGSRMVSTFVGRDFGYSHVFFVDDPIAPYLGSLNRDKRFFVTLTVENFSGEGLVSAMVVPFYDRCAYYYATGSSAATHSKTVQYGYKYQRDPWHCNTWRNFPGFTGVFIGNHWVQLAQHPSGCGPVTARTVLAPGAIYLGFPCSDYTDQGGWCQTCDNAESMAYFIPEPPTPAGTSQEDQRIAHRSTWLISAGTEEPLSIEFNKVFLGAFSGFENPWFIGSPDPNSGDTQFAMETHVALGSGTAMQYSHDPKGSLRVVGEPLPPGFEQDPTTFVGVVP